MHQRNGWSCRILELLESMKVERGELHLAVFADENRDVFFSYKKKEIATKRKQPFCIFLNKIL